MKEKVEKLLGEKIKESGQDHGQYWIKVEAEQIGPVLEKLCKDEKLFDMLTDICGLDNETGEDRFQVIYHILSTQEKKRLRIKIDVPQDSMSVPSVCHIFRGADWLERETYDMYGIRFKDHPDLRRILMHEDFLDYPLRRDFPLRGWREEVD